MKKRVSEPYIDSNNSTTSVAQALRENEVLRQIISERLGLNQEQIQQIVQERTDVRVPVSIFRSGSTLEVVATYLVDVKKMSYAEIAVLLKRDDRTIWHAYKRAQEKKIVLRVLDSEVTVPLSLFADRTYAPLEVVVQHLRAQQLTFPQIAALLDRSPKTIWTVHSRVQKKNGR